MARCVVIEDHPDLASLMVMTLESHGHEATAVVSGVPSILTPEAWEGVDVAFVDLMLPEMPGEEILLWLRDHAPHVRRVVLSAVASFRKEVVAIADVVLNKPAGVNEILAAIDG